MPSLLQLTADLGRAMKSRGLVEQCLARIADQSGEGQRVFLKVHTEEALATADYCDRLRARGAAPSPFAGIPVSIKDLFDIAGGVTTAGSIVLKDAPAAKHDAPAVARLRAAGFIPIGRTNMTEFAFSGLGINPHYDTPFNPYERQAGRIPGGSSSGAAVSVTDGMAFGALGTDTGGSCRIPAALCGIVGFKPTAHRVPTAGAFPLSTSLDSIGPLAATVACCAVLDAVLAGEPAIDLTPFPLAGLRLALSQTMVLENLEPAVARTFESALSALRKAGARIDDVALRELAELPQINAKGGLAAAEAYAIHRRLIAKADKMYDPRVLSRIMRGQEQDAADYIDLVNARADFIRRVDAVTAPYDALVMPTVPVTAPRLADLADDAAYRSANFLVLRNPSIANFLNRCSISIPCHRVGDAPVGLMLIGEHGDDRRLLSIAAAIEAVVSPGLA
ncbi:MAG: amidase [Alphaproteobacteria bacterium]|nr:MAG: amidase [Alphaproteobacteria bacterium]TMJ98684.1 MAG: amidase [Alphaproteobacteria bacterium]